jgi:hypothetical protein
MLLGKVSKFVKGGRWVKYTFENSGFVGQIADLSPMAKVIGLQVFITGLEQYIEGYVTNSI